MSKKRGSISRVILGIHETTPQPRRQSQTGNMVETRGQQASRETEKRADESSTQVSSTPGLTKEESTEGPPSLEPDLGTALAIVVPIMAIFLGIFAHKLGVIYIPGLDSWLDPILKAIPPPQKRSRKLRE